MFGYWAHDKWRHMEKPFEWATVGINEFFTSAALVAQVIVLFGCPLVHRPATGRMNGQKGIVLQCYMHRSLPSDPM